MNPTNGNSNQSSPDLIDQLKNFLMGNSVLRSLANGVSPGGGNYNVAQPLTMGAAPAPIQHFGNDDYMKNAVNQYLANSPSVPASVKKANTPTAIVLAGPNNSKKKSK
jgi:hypothetical protein